MKNILILAVKEDKAYSNVIASYIKSKGVKCAVLGWNDLTIGKDSLGEKILNKLNRLGIVPSQTLVHTRSAGKRVAIILSKLERLGFFVYNSSLTAALTSNKYLAQIFAREKNIPTTNTYLVGKDDLELLKLILKKEKKIVIKPVYSRGQGVFCYLLKHKDSESEIKRILKLVPGEEIVVQKYVEYKKLIRMIYIGSQVLSNATTFDEPGNGWKCSVCENPNIKVLKKVPYKLIKLTEKIARSFRLDIGFIDIFKTTNNKFVLNEINTACDLSIHERKSKVAIHEKIGDYLIEKLSEL